MSHNLNNGITMLNVNNGRMPLNSANGKWHWFLWTKWKLLNGLKLAVFEYTMHFIYLAFERKSTKMQNLFFYENEID